MIAFGPVISASSKFVDDTQYVIYEYIFQFWTIKWIKIYVPVVQVKFSISPNEKNSLNEVQSVVL